MEEAICLGALASKTQSNKSQYIERKAQERWAKTLTPL
ncbi:hypothetical protein BSM4216_2505 [Bacillus smithii]|nr:hypothetical protein BSM4216_2505 [Bacillus smithii]